MQRNNKEKTVAASQLFNESAQSIFQTLSDGVYLSDLKQFFKDVYLYGWRGETSSNDFYPDYAERDLLLYLYEGLGELLHLLSAYHWFGDFSSIEISKADAEQIQEFFEDGFDISKMLSALQDMAMVSVLYKEKAGKVAQEEKERLYYSYSQLKEFFTTYKPQ